MERATAESDTGAAAAAPGGAPAPPMRGAPPPPVGVAYPVELLPTAASWVLTSAGSGSPRTHRCRRPGNPPAGWGDPYQPGTVTLQIAERRCSPTTRGIGRLRADELPTDLCE